MNDLLYKIFLSQFKFNNLKKIFFFFCFFECAFVFSAEKKVVLGSENGWQNSSYKENVTTSKGYFGYDSLELETNTLKENPSTQLLLSFENGFFEAKGNTFQIVENHLVASNDSVKGKISALSRGLEKGMILEQKNDIPQKITTPGGSFSIEFWISPSIAENGEKIFNYKTSTSLFGDLNYQIIDAVFENNRIVWNLKNIFPDFKENQITLKGYSPVIPGIWSHHVISFDEENGLLEYFVDGKSEDLIFVTSTGHEDGSVCRSIFGNRRILEICPNYTGKIDEVCVSTSAYRADEKSLFRGKNGKYSTEGGLFVSEPILAGSGSRLNKIESLAKIPEETQIKYYVRSGENRYNWTKDFPSWKEVLPGEEIEGVEGQFFQTAVELLSDGWGEKSPSLTELSLYYTQAELPLPPFIVNAQSGDGEVTLSWNYSVDDSAEGYYVYYGNRSGEYLGSVATEGVSPIKVGNKTSITLTGLQNSKIYYFAVVSYSKYDSNIIGEFSKEVYARPSKSLAKD